MKQSTIFLPFAALALVASPALAGEQKPAPAAAAEQEAYIPFANHGGVWDWRSEGTETIYFQDNHRQWYRAKLFAPATDLPWVQFIGIDAGPTGRLDKWSSVYIHGQRYPLSSLVKIEGKPPKVDKKKADAKK